MMNSKMMHIVDKNAALSLDEAAGLLADTVQKGRMVYLFSGDMWSNGVFEPFFQPGMLCALSPMPEPTLSTTSCASRAYYLKDAPHVGEFLCGYYRSLTPGDCILIADHGDSLHSAEAIAFAESHGIRTIHVSPTPGCADVTVALDAGDAPLSNSAAVSIAISCLSCAMIEQAAQLLDAPDVWLPFTKENENANQRLIDQYRTLVKKL